MKRIITVAAVIMSLVIPSVSLAVPTDFSGGVNNEYRYEEVVFLTGEPIKFVGEVTIKESDKKGKKSVSYTMKNMVPHEDYMGKYDGAKYTKSVTYDTDYSDHVGIGQTTGKTTVGKSKESLQVDGVKIDLKDYQFFKSDAIDNRAASDFYSGDITARKYYEVTGDGEGTITVDISGTNSGYENFWGVTETQSIDHTISANIVGEEEPEGAEPPAGAENAEEKPDNVKMGKWTGTVNIKSSDSLTKTLRYSSNDAQHSSFEGGNVKVTNEEAVSKYRYNLGNGVAGTINLNAQKVPQLDRLIIPKFRDVNGHWAAEDIHKLYSLDVFGGSNTIFSPDTPMSRIDFTKAIVKSCDIRGNDDGEKKTRRKNSKEESIFTDLAISHDDYEYVKSAVEKGIIAGSQDQFGNRTFLPDSNLSRAQAITILVRALGFENRAPNPGYVTTFADDKDIPSWAKDSIYMAKEMNLVQGDPANRVNPDKQLSRAEASTLLVRFLEFLEHDLQKDYRENIVNFN